MATIQLGTLKVTGKDAQTFLQGQLTTDIRELSPATHQLTAFCNRQGRVLALMNMFRLNDDYYLTLPMEIIELIQNELQKYIVAAKVTIENISTTYTISLTDTFLHAQLKAKIPFIGLPQTGKFLPHPLGLVDLGVINFKKGCFVGQEIIARMQHRGNIKSKIMYLEYHGNQTPIPDEALLLEGAEKVTVVNAIDLGSNQYALLVF